MWRTACGERVLLDKERSLFIHAAACLLDDLLEDEPDCALGTGVAQFDHLEPNARIVLLRDVVQALTDLTIPAPELNALNEATVHAVFEFARSEVEMEIECEGMHLDLEWSQAHDAHFWRRLVLAAYLEGRGPDAGGDGEREEWVLLLDCLADQILWDRDWELEEIMDAAPEQAQMLKRRLGIDEEYFLATAAEPIEGQVKEATTFLRQLVEDDQRRA